MLVGAATGAWFAAITDDPYLVRTNVAASVVAITVLAAGLAFLLPVTIPVAIALLGAEYVAILGFEAEALDTQAPLVAGALLAIAELGYWSLELRGAVVDEAGTYLRRIALLARSIKLTKSFIDVAESDVRQRKVIGGDKTLLPHPVERLENRPC